MGSSWPTCGLGDYWGVTQETNLRLRWTAVALRVIVERVDGGTRRSWPAGSDSSQRLSLRAVNRRRPGAWQRYKVDGNAVGGGLPAGDLRLKLESLSREGVMRRPRLPHKESSHPSFNFHDVHTRTVTQLVFITPFLQHHATNELLQFSGYDCVITIV